LRPHLPGCGRLAVGLPRTRGARFDHPIGIWPEIQGCRRRKPWSGTAAWLPLSRYRTRATRNPPWQRGGWWPTARGWGVRRSFGLRRAEGRLRLVARLRPHERQNSPSLAHARPPGAGAWVPAPGRQWITRLAHLQRKYGIVTERAES
jgi:hypothetical protein